MPVGGFCMAEQPEPNHSKRVLQQLLVGVAFGLAAGGCARRNRNVLRRAFIATFVLLHLLEYLDIVVLPWMAGAWVCDEVEELFAGLYCLIRRQFWVYLGFLTGYYVMVGEPDL